MHKTLRNSMLRAAAPALLLCMVTACGSSGDSSAGPSESVFGGRSGDDGSGSGSGGGGSDDFPGLGGSGGGNEAGSSSGGNTGETCFEDTHVAERVPANLLLVVDRSGSMNCNLPPLQSTAECEVKLEPEDENLGEERKWDATKAALEGALDSLLAQGDVRVGLSMFPRYKEVVTPEGATVKLKCHVESQPNIPIKSLDAGQRADLSSFFTNSVSLEGSTPLAGAAITGYEHLHDDFDGDGRKFLVLITDGLETCANNTSYPEDLKSHYAPGALSVGIQTFVIGVPGSEGGREELSKIAYAGGTAASATCDDATGDSDVCHFDLTDSNTDLATDLEGALAEIRNSLVSCELALPEPADVSVDASKVIVRVNGDHVLEDNSGPCENGVDGWQYNSARDGIILCGTACEDASQSDATVIIALGCPPPK